MDANVQKNDFFREKVHPKLCISIKCSNFAPLFGVIAGRKLRVACYVALER